MLHDRLWKPLIQAKLEDGTLTPGDLIPVTSGADATPVPAHPQYCEHRNVIVGLCGPNIPLHKCSTDAAEQILDGEAGIMFYFCERQRMLFSHYYAITT